MTEIHFIQRAQQKRIADRTRAMATHQFRPADRFSEDSLLAAVENAPGGAETLALWRGYAALRAASVGLGSWIGLNWRRSTGPSLAVEAISAATVEVFKAQRDQTLSGSQVIGCYLNRLGEQLQQIARYQTETLWRTEPVVWPYEQVAFDDWAEETQSKMVYLIPVAEAVRDQEVGLQMCLISKYVRAADVGAMLRWKASQP